MAINYLKQLFSNNASTLLAASVSPTDTVISVVDGSRFPTPGPDSAFLITISNGSDLEVIEVHGRSGNTLTGCVRGLEGTSAQAFAAASRVENRLTAGTIAQFARLADRLAPASTLTELTKTELLNNNSYLISETDNASNPIIAVASLGRWRFVNYPTLVLDQLVGATSTTTSVDYVGATDLSTLFSERGLIIQFTTGLNRGQCRIIQAASPTSITWATPLPNSLTQGDRFEVYQSSTAKMDMMNTQVQWLLAQAGLGGGNFANFVTSAALQTELSKISIKKSVRVATTTSISLSGLQTIDGVSVLGGDRVLVKDQTSGAQNGIYVADSGTWVRSADADANGEIAPGMVIGVNAGTTQADTFWKVINDTDITLGVTNIVFANLMAGYATLASPALTGTPTAPTAAANTNNSQVATTAFVRTQITTDAAPIAHVGATGAAHGVATTAAAGFMSVADKIKLDGVSTSAAAVGSVTPLMNGAAAVGTSSMAARSDHVHPTDTTRAPLASPALTGTPTAPTAAAGTSTTQIATTAFVSAEIDNDRPFEATLANIKMDGAASVGTANTVARGDHVHPTDTTRAPLASPALTGTPTAPTAAAGTNTTQVATTAFVSTAVSNAAATAVQKDSNTGAATLPAGTTAQRPANGIGKMRLNVDTGRFEGNNGTSWGSLGGATGGGNDAVFYLNSQTVTTNYTVPSGQNAMSAGPVSVANGVTVTVSPGSVWSVV